MSDDWPGGFISAKKLMEVEEEEQDVTVFNDHGTIYASGDDGWLYMEDRPTHLENTC
jgi:hypothetical protein